MVERVLETLREALSRWDRYTARQFNAPLTRELIGGAR